MIFDYRNTKILTSLSKHTFKRRKSQNPLRNCLQQIASSGAKWNLIETRRLNASQDFAMSDKLKTYFTFKEKFSEIISGSNDK